jgi:L-ascorbate metabolism protein UlaG (beta-lactamase superfamily)
MELRLIRHATLFLAYHGINFMIDPMFSPAGALDPVRDSPNQRRNPLVDMPVENRELEQLIDRIDAVLLTHTHFDHWDSPARDLLPKALPLFCQPGDAEQIVAAGFNAVESIANETSWRGIRIVRTGGQHGTGTIGRRMGPVSGYVLSAGGDPAIYIAGDTIWCEEVETAIDHHRPDLIVLNAGAAQFNQGDPITMNAADVSRVCHTASTAQVVAVHMEAINHCSLSRRDLSQALEAQVASNQLLIPHDGQHYTIES